MTRKRKPYHVGPKPPWSYSVELTWGCPLRCPFCACGNEAIFPKGTYKYMTIETARTVAKRIADFTPKTRIEFAASGEPTKNPRCLDIIGVFRQELPLAQLQLTTNGLAFSRQSFGAFEESVYSYFRRGINIMLFDTYRPTRDRWNELFAQWRPGLGVKLHRYPEGPSPWHRHPKGTMLLIVMDDLRDLNVTARRFNNHSGLVDWKRALDAGLDEPGLRPTAQPLPKRCARPFVECVIKHDGMYGACCNDFQPRWQGPSVIEQSIQSFWLNCDGLNLIRHNLHNKDRNMIPCRECSYQISERVGLHSYDPFDKGKGATN